MAGSSFVSSTFTEKVKIFEKLFTPVYSHNKLERLSLAIIFNLVKARDKRSGHQQWRHLLVPGTIDEGRKKSF
jgi:hypothetical protein